MMHVLLNCFFHVCLPLGLASYKYAACEYIAEQLLMCSDCYWHKLAPLHSVLMETILGVGHACIVNSAGGFVFDTGAETRSQYTSQVCLMSCTSQLGRHFM